MPSSATTSPYDLARPLSGDGGFGHRPRNVLAVPRTRRRPTCPGRPCSSWYEAVRRPLPWRFDSRPVGDPRLRGDAAADPGGARRAALRALPRALPDRRRRSRPRPRRRRSPPGAGSATTAACSRCRRRRAWWPSAAGLRPSGWRSCPASGPTRRRRSAPSPGMRRSAAVDTNVRRVIERRDGVRRPARALARRAAELVPEGRAAAWNQAMMELGATVCRPRRPRCGGVPAARRLRRARRAGAAAAAARRSASRAPTAGRAGACSPRSSAARRRRRWRRQRRERALAGLERDGLVVRGPGGEPRLP